MNNETQNTIQKIEESLSRQNYTYANEADPMKKIVRAIWMVLGIVLLAVTLITITGWLTLEEEPTTFTNQVQSR